MSPLISYSEETTLLRASKDEVIELDKILKSNPGMTYGSEIMTDEDREQINDLIASYFWVKNKRSSQ